MEAAYILHTRPYGNTSLLLDVFTEAQGRVSLLARSARGPSSRYRGQLQLFTPMFLTWRGRFELKNLHSCELAAKPFHLHQEALLCGFYMNELLMRVLYKEDAHPALFSAYQETLSVFEQGLILPTLRLFEKKLLSELGYALSFVHICKENAYRFIPEQGFLACAAQEANAFSGTDLLRIAIDDLTSEAAQKAAKRLMRMALQPLLGERPLYSRELFA